MNADPAAVAAAVRARAAKAAARARRLAGRRCRRACAQVTDAAEPEAERLKDDYVSTEHLFSRSPAEGGRAPGGADPAAARRHAGTRSSRR